jgi:CheY-like chemotaxis protein
MNKKCLIIDDVEVSRYVLSVHMSELGFEVFEADDEGSALAILDKNKCDVVIIDWHLRHESGLELIPRMRKVKGGEQMAVFVCSGVEQGGGASSAVKQSGAQVFLSKPVTCEHLEVELKKIGVI